MHLAASEKADDRQPAYDADDEQPHVVDLAMGCVSVQSQVLGVVTADRAQAAEQLREVSRPKRDSPVADPASSNQEHHARPGEKPGPPEKHQHSYCRDGEDWGELMPGIHGGTERQHDE